MKGIDFCFILCGIFSYSQRDKCVKYRELFQQSFSTIQQSKSFWEYEQIKKNYYPYCLALKLKV